MLSPTRRSFLALGAIGGLSLLCGCTDEGDKDRKQAEDADRAVRIRAVAATDALLASYDAVIAGPGAGQADTLQDLREDVAQHRAALAQGLPAATGSPSPSGSGAPAASVAALAAAERQTAAARLADLDGASPELARLLASVSASNAAHAAALGDTGQVAPAPAASGSPSPSAAASGPASATGSGSGSASPSAKPSPYPSPQATALQSALAAEHAAVYGYGVVGALLPVGPQREDGRASYAAHQARRDGWQRLLANGGVSPTAAAPGYRLPFAVKDAAGAKQLAAYIETQLTGAYVELTGTSTGALRAEGAAALRETALRAVHWGAELPALPGMPAADGAASGAPSNPPDSTGSASPSA
ncbi:ferritin-like domain-containing protein [Kitasatospora sp. NPDC048365]|uniref:ferritin-like domain-containing protein n=1 Tax=Kitasatospora sp. NPDC048365 TaxID=3364050 RepID=UPI00372421A1